MVLLIVPDQKAHLVYLEQNKMFSVQNFKLFYILAV